MSVIRVLIADDSPVARDVLRHLLTREGDIQIVGEARNGHEAVALARTLAPQLITMDLSMPVMEGLAAIEEIMHTRALPILVVSDRFEAAIAGQALALGALEVMPKPALDDTESSSLLERVRLLAGVAVITRLRPRALKTYQTLAAPPTHRSLAHVVAIACSTGGPQALARLLSRLPSNFALPVVIAQHMSHGFIEGMAQWLDSLCRLPVRVASHGEALTPATVYLAPSESDLEITFDHHFRLVESPIGALYHPSCDALLTSAAAVYGRKAIGVILTGMGSDGVQGMRAICAAGGMTLAQDEASSVIYGMNRQAINAGAVQRVASLDELPELLIATTQGSFHFGSSHS
ncbi:MULTISPECIES: chemotaxis-specific protein-glutamate methyltransferase CheB [unclassified Halomonas]|uniref:chemotaxis-specific protein-glutamate methyltransferase CheB n=1 Tax=unclassified Halomonas TaxID=2609666 RepID=UPI002076A74D|nr:MULTISPECIES: chemotaxis-specific protein-glutamate methyltransferase CheB [unclassified Halomonas]